MEVVTDNAGTRYKNKMIRKMLFEGRHTRTIRKSTTRGGIREDKKNDNMFAAELEILLSSRPSDPPKSDTIKNKTNQTSSQSGSRSPLQQFRSTIKSPIFR